LILEFTWAIGSRNSTDKNLVYYFVNYHILGFIMFDEKNVQNGTYKKLGKEVGIVAAVNSDLKVNVSVYLSERDKYKTEFNAWSKKTAQSTLEMCRVVFEAKQNLSKDDFKIFANDVSSRTTVTKYLAIGEKYEQFYQYANLLPNAWTSIYEITQLPSEMFVALVTTENSMVNMTGAQIKKLMGKGTEDNSKAAAATAAVTSEAQTADQSSKTTSDASEDDAASSSTDATEVATASSDASSSESDRAFAKQATSTMLEQAVSAAASTTVNAFPQVPLMPYEVLIRFNTIPTDDTWFDLVEEIENLIEKYNFDVDVIETRPQFV
jgi:hypothetical protein